MKLKNNDERKKWLRNYKDWGLWYKDERIGAKYYKYELPNGATIVVNEFFIPADGLCPAMTHADFHIFGGPRPTADPNMAWQKIYSPNTISEPALAEYLKKMIGKDVDL